MQIEILVQPENHQDQTMLVCRVQSQKKASLLQKWAQNSLMF